MTEQVRSTRGRRRRSSNPATDGDKRGGDKRGGGKRIVDYHSLRNPFPPTTVFSEDRVEAIHNNALRVLEELGMKVLLPQAREIYREAGAQVDENNQMVHIGREIVENALASAPRSITMRAGTRNHDLVLELGRLTLLPGAGAPHATDLIRGRRPATISDFRELMQLTHYFEALHMLPPVVEPQDVPVNLRHYAMTEAQLTLSDKIPSIYARGTPQTLDCFEMIRDFRNISDQEFQATPYSYTIINTNSPRQLDIPMAQGLIDFARYGQMSIVTPFCMMGAMAPVTVAGALMLSHAEALAAITLSQLARPGAPVCYGAFASNVDMRSGSPAFGTPEQVKANLGAGQLARRIGLPWRCAAGCAANTNDAQAAHETQMSAWGAVLAGCTVLVHGAGWIEGGLTVSFEKLITDMEIMQIFAELCSPTPADDADIAFDALAEIPPGGHFFSATHTMSRYQSAFYEPLIADWSNFGTWSERGAADASTRATGLWQKIVATAPPPPLAASRVDALKTFIEKRTRQGGAHPQS